MPSHRAIVRALYVLAGLWFLFVGVVALLQKIPLGAGGDPEIRHVMQEAGCVLVFAGVVTLWFSRRVEASKGVFIGLTVFWALIAIVHWMDIDGGIRTGLSPWINTVPFLVFVAVGFLARDVWSGTSHSAAP
jgi:hypothetical protein